MGEVKHKMMLAEPDLVSLRLTAKTFVDKHKHL